MSGTIISPTFTLDQEERVRELVQEELKQIGKESAERVFRILREGPSASDCGLNDE